MGEATTHFYPHNLFLILPLEISLRFGALKRTDKEEAIIKANIRIVQ